MGVIKTRRNGNSLTVTVPKSFNIEEGIPLRPRLTDKGIFYEFVDEDDFYNFGEDILKDLVSQGYEGQYLVKQFKKIKKEIPAAMGKLISNAERDAANSKPMSKEEFEREIGL